MKSLQIWLEEYGQDHQNPANQKMHRLCVPLIFFSIVGALHLLPVQIFQIGLGDVLIGMGLIWYFLLGWRAFLLMLVQVIIALGVLTLLPQAVSVWVQLFFIFVVAWIGQFIGHHWERKKPSFLRDLQYLLIGPLWVWLGQHV